MKLKNNIIALASLALLSFVPAHATVAGVPSAAGRVSEASDTMILLSIAVGFILIAKFARRERAKV